MWLEERDPSALPSRSGALEMEALRSGDPPHDLDWLMDGEGNGIEEECPHLATPRCREGLFLTEG